MFERTSAHLVQPPDQIRARCEVTPGSSGSYWLESWKPSMVEAVHHTRTASSAGEWFSWWKCFSFYQIWSFHFNLHFLALVIPLCASMKSPAPQGSQNHVFSRADKPWLCSLSLEDESLPASSLPPELALLCWGAQILAGFWVGLMNAAQRGINPSLGWAASSALLRYPCAWWPFLLPTSSSMASSRELLQPSSPQAVSLHGVASSLVQDFVFALMNFIRAPLVPSPSLSWSLSVEVLHVPAAVPRVVSPADLSVRSPRALVEVLSSTGAMIHPCNVQDVFKCWL